MDIINVYRRRVGIQTLWLLVVTAWANGVSNHILRQTHTKSKKYTYVRCVWVASLEPLIHPVASVFLVLHTIIHRSNHKPTSYAS